MTVTNNRNISLPTVGGDSGTWGNILNSGVMSQLDLILGATQAVSITSSDVTLSLAQWNNCAIRLSGTLTGNQNLILPFNANSSTVAVGGLFVIDNQTDGDFKVTVITEASGSTGVEAPQGVRTFLFSDTTNVWYADDAKAYLIPYAGNPNGNVAGTAAGINKPPSTVIDYTNTILYVCTTTGNAASAVWTNIVAASAPLPVPQGYLTATSNTPIITSSVTATTIYYTPYVGDWAVIHNGNSFIGYQFSQMQLTLSSSQAANGIYDIYLAYNGGTPVIGTGPSWTSGSGGSVTAGSCARGTGAGGAALSVVNGVMTNAASMSLIYNTGSGNNTITVAANQGVYLGSIFIDGTAGRVTCHRSIGQNRKWGIYNAYNQQIVQLQVTDSGTWNYSSSTVRASNASPSSYLGTKFNASSGTDSNGANVFLGLATSSIEVRFNQSVNCSSNGSAESNARIGIGWNSTTSYSGKIGSAFSSLASTNANAILDVSAVYISAPVLGLSIACCCESVPYTLGATTAKYYSGSDQMIMTVAYAA